MKIQDAVEACSCLDFLEAAIVGKARGRPSILSDDGLVREILSLARRLVREARLAVGSPEFRRRLRIATGIDWRGATAAARERAIQAAVDLLRGAPSEFRPGVEVALRGAARRVVLGTRRAIGREHPSLKVDPVFGKADARAVEAISTTSSLHFTATYEGRADRFAERAQRVIARGLESGLGRREIASDLRAEFQDAAIPESYFQVIASVHVTRARSFSSLSTYAEGGFERYAWVAIQDGRVCPVCDDLNGRIFSIEKGLGILDQIEDARDVEDLKAAAPFVRDSVDGVFLPSGRRMSGASDAEVQDEGVGVPPAHEMCRCTLVVKP